MSFQKTIDYRFLQYIRAARMELPHGKFTPRLAYANLPLAPPRAPSLRSQPIIFTCADPTYLSRYGESFTNSLLRHVDQPWLHVHLYNMQQESSEILRSLSQKHPGLTLTWSSEEFDPSEWENRAPASSKQSWKSLYICCSRFLMARRIMYLYGQGILVFDIDILINGDVCAPFRQSEEIHYALMPRFEQRNLCKKTLGGIVFAAHSNLGLEFINTACTYIERFLERGSYWFAFDQYALYRALMKLRNIDQHRHFMPLTKELVSFDLSPNALIIYPKGSAKTSKSFIELQAESLSAPKPF